jgi:hypothetical protein
MLYRAVVRRLLSTSSGSFGPSRRPTITYKEDGANKGPPTVLAKPIPAGTVTPSCGPVVTAADIDEGLLLSKAKAEAAKARTFPSTASLERALQPASAAQPPGPTRDSLTAQGVPVLERGRHSDSHDPTDGHSADGHSSTGHGSTGSPGSDGGGEAGGVVRRVGRTALIKNMAAMLQSAAREADKSVVAGAVETGGPKGVNPTRYGDWERRGRVSDF